MKCSPHKVGLVVGITLGGWHLVWSVLVALGWAGVVLDFVLGLHMLHLVYVVGPFEITTAACLVVLTTVVGYVAGYVVGVAWNKVHKN